ERSRRLLLLRAIVDEVAKSPETSAPLPSPEDAWDLLARTQHVAPSVLDLVLAHPYTGSWAGYTMRLISSHITGVGPLWAHVGHVHALAASAAIQAGIRFDTTIPVWQGNAILPMVGMVRLPIDEPWSVAEIRGRHGNIEIDTGSVTVRLPADLTTDAPGWWAVRRTTRRTGGHELAVRLDDIDPYRGPYEPLPPQRLDDTDANVWRGLLADAWTLIRRCRPATADAMRAGLDSIVPRPPMRFRTASASSDDAFGSAIVARPPDAATLAAMLVHEFQHNLLSVLLRLVQLTEADPRERLYAPWRNDPRPIDGVVQGLYAFFGVTAFWRALARTDLSDRTAAFEFTYHRAITWRTLTALRGDAAMTGTGRRFLDGIADVLGPWQDESVAADIADAAATVGTDHYLGWRIRYVRPAAAEDLAAAWLTEGTPSVPDGDDAPTPVPDGDWSHARANLCRLLMAAGPNEHASPLTSVPDATHADLALTTGRFLDAARGYRAELTKDPDRPASWTGLILALSAMGTSPAVRTLLRRPELVRAVHRAIRTRATQGIPTPEELADWLSRFIR
ncbi:MAG TPA: HEXXH motif domain-containing protein, partial [Pseudonocardiaceae bacterium]|nr:HEXXH motif domain-containing protein [Pseudonocardiaceae bacterium]